MPHSLNTSPTKTAIIYMGGTFGCAHTPLSPLPADIFLPKLQAACTGISNHRYDYFYSTQIKDSSHIEPRDWHMLIQQIEQLRAQDYSHILIIHGTDTMAYSAAFLSEQYAQQPITLLFTGSQQPLLNAADLNINPHSDALHNLSYALQTLPQLTTGVWLAFDQHCWAAQTTQKIHTTAAQAFAGTSTSPSAQPSPTQPMLTDAQLSHLSKINIAVFYCTPLPDEQITQQLQHLLSTPHLDALIILAFGQGNMHYHPQIEKQLHTAQQQGILIILSTQVAFGGTAPTYAAGEWLQRIGCISAHQHPIAALYAKTIYCCCQNLDRQQRKRALALSLA